MILDSCAQQRTYEKFFGLTAQVRDAPVAIVIVKNDRFATIVLVVKHETLIQLLT